jgi:hypothetical protein
VAFADEGRECVITSAHDSDHLPTSKHYQGFAVDIRNRDLTLQEKDRVLDKLKRLERYGFDVIDELPKSTLRTTGPHFHIEYDPKEGEKFWRYL